MLPALRFLPPPAARRGRGIGLVYPRAGPVATRKSLRLGRRRPNPAASGFPGGRVTSAPPGRPLAPPVPKSPPVRQTPAAPANFRSAALLFPQVSFAPPRASGTVYLVRAPSTALPRGGP